jgi:hypothetical protein
MLLKEEGGSRLIFLRLLPFSLPHFPDLGKAMIQFLKTIDSFHISSRIAPNMFIAIALPRTRRPKPTSLRRLGVFCFDGE